MAREGGGAWQASRVQTLEGKVRDRRQIAQWSPRDRTVSLLKIKMD